MTDENKNGVDEHGNPVPPQTPPEAAKTPGAGDGTTPDITERLKVLEDENAKNKEERDSFKVAMQEERQKRQEAQQRIQQLEESIAAGKPKPEDEVLNEFDETEVESFKKLSKALGIVYKSDLEAEKALEAQKENEANNISLMNKFMGDYANLFGSSASATEQQEKNWTVFTSYINDTFDINKNTLPNVKNLDNKLAAAIRILTNNASADEMKEKAKLEVMTEQQNAALLSVGAGGATRPSEDGWGRKTPKNVIVDNLRMAGYSEAEIKEMTEAKK